MALHKAILEGRLVQFRILLQGVKGVDANARDRDSKTPLMICSSVSHERLSMIFATHLLSWGADVGLPDKHGRNALCWACWKGNTSLVETLLDAHPDVCHYDMRQTDNKGNTALHYAALGGNKLIVKVMIESFIALNVALNPLNKRGETPVNVALKHGHIDGARVFVDLGQAQIYFDDSDEDTPRRWFKSEVNSRVPSGRASPKTAAMMSGDKKLIKDAFADKKEAYRRNQRVEAEGGTAVKQKLPMISQIFNEFDSQFSSLYRSGAVTPPEPEAVEVDLETLALGTAANAMKFTHLLKHGKDGSSRTPSTNDTSSRSSSRVGGGDNSRGPSRFGGMMKRKSSTSGKDSKGSGRASSMKQQQGRGGASRMGGGGGGSRGAGSRMGGKASSMGQIGGRGAGSRMGAASSMTRMKQSQNRQQSTSRIKTNAADSKRAQSQRLFNKARLNSAKARLRQPIRPRPNSRMRRGSWPTDPATIRRLTPKEQDPFRSRGVNSFKKWRSMWDLDNQGILQLGLEKLDQVKTGRHKKGSKGGKGAQKYTPRKGGKGAADFRKGFRSKFDLSSHASFVDITDLMPSRSPPLMNRSTNAISNGASSPPQSNRNKSPGTGRAKKDRRGRGEPVAELIVEPVRSPGWINRRIKKLQEDIRILEARAHARHRKSTDPKSILKSFSDDDSYKQLRPRLIKEFSSEDEPRAGIFRQTSGKEKPREKKRVRIITRQNSTGSSAKSSGASSDESEFELSDQVKTAELLKAFLEKNYQFQSSQGRYLPAIVRRPAVAPPAPIREVSRNMASISLSSKPRLSSRPPTSLYPGQGLIVSDAATLARYHNNPLSNVGINPSVGYTNTKSMQVLKPIVGFWRPNRPIWMG